MDNKNYRLVKDFNNLLMQLNEKIPTIGFKLSFFPSLFLVGFVCLFNCSCNGDPDPDPCEDQIQNFGGFTIGEVITNYGDVDSVIVSDTVLTDNTIQFDADTIYSSYEWKVGDDPRTFNTKTFTLSFTEPYASITVRLIAKWTPNKTCFPNDDDIDTVYRKLTVIDKELNPIFGQYTGALESKPSETYTVGIEADFFSSEFLLSNINNGCEMSNVNIVMAFGYKVMSISEDASHGVYNNGCKNPRGWLYLDKDNKTLTADYSIGNGSEVAMETKRFNEKFNGTKIN